MKINTIYDRTDLINITTAHRSPPHLDRDSRSSSSCFSFSSATSASPSSRHSPFPVRYSSRFRMMVLTGHSANLISHWRYRLRHPRRRRRHRPRTHLPPPAGRRPETSQFDVIAHAVRRSRASCALLRAGHHRRVHSALHDGRRAGQNLRAHVRHLRIRADGRSRFSRFFFAPVLASWDATASPRRHGDIRWFAGFAELTTRCRSSLG